MMINYNSREYREHVMNMIADTSAKQASLDMLNHAWTDSLDFTRWAQQERMEAELLCS